MLKEIKKVLMTGIGEIIIGFHAKKQLRKRGYSKGDLVSVIFNGNIVERQSYNKIAIAGRDTDNNPVIVIVAKIGERKFKIVTVIPPIDHNRFKDCV